MSRDYLDDINQSKELIYRHFAWLTTLRYSMREGRNWEAQSKPNNQKYQAEHYSVPEKETSLEDELKKYLSPDELAYILTTKNKAAQILSLQSKATKELFKRKEIEDYRFVSMQGAKTYLTNKEKRKESKTSHIQDNLQLSMQYLLRYFAIYFHLACSKILTN